MKEYIDAFNESINSIRDFVYLLDPIIRSKLDNTTQYHQYYILAEMLSSIVDSVNNISPDYRNMLLSSKKDLERKIPDTYKPMFQTASTPMNFNTHSSTLDGELSLAGTCKEVNQHPLLVTMSRLNNHSEQIYNSSLINLLRSAEYFFTQLLHFHYKNYPESACMAESKLTFSQLLEFTNIDDAKNHVLSMKIENIVRGNFESWISMLKKEIKIQLTLKDALITSITEIYQRRNIIVHNGGIVNGIYLDSLKLRNKGTIKEGDKLAVSKEYLEESICLLHSTFIIIASQLWIKQPDTKLESIAQYLCQLMYENALKCRWNFVKSLCEYIKSMKKIPDQYIDIAIVYYLLSIKRIDGKESIAKELAAIDIKKHTDICEIGSYALKDDFEYLERWLDGDTESQYLHLFNIGVDPLFEEFRQSDKYDKYIKKYGSYYMPKEHQ